MPAPLEGLKVVDIGWLMVGPMSARYLTELGADTVKVESGKRLDPLRGLGPFKDGQSGPERSLSYHWINAGKRGLAVDLKSPRGPDLVRRLVAGADVFIESFTPGAIDEMGLSYARLAAANPGLIMVSTGILGRKGTMGLGMSGTGMTGSAYAGATNLVGWPDRAPTGPHGPWTDSVAPRFVVAATLAALHRRGATGKGTYIDLAQAEAGIQFLTPAYFDFAVNGMVAGRSGTAGSPLRAPCGAYPCAGADRWIVIDADTPQAWDALRGLLSPSLDDSRFSTLVGRLRSRQTIDARIADWTRTRQPAEAEALLQDAGVPAHAVSNDQELAFDPDLEAAGYHRRIDDPLIGEGWIPGPQYRLAGTPHVATRAGPRIGDASAEVLTGELGLSAADVAGLKQEGVIE
ncbi:MAG TPA: CoA transferase [Caulobacteraceae bacterium]|nr:CoA transferase [Caulobacteraceae bacterium]